MRRYGNDHDGGYLLCENFVRTSEALINIGIRRVDEFGCSLTSRHPIPNYQFDCSDPVKPKCETNDGNDVYLKVCVSDRSEWTEEYNYASLKDMIDSNNLKGRHITLKIDAEGAEWVGLRSLPVAYLDYIDQLIVEFHLPGASIQHLAYWGNLETLRSLSKSFVSVNLHMNNNACHKNFGFQPNRYFSSYVFEVTLVNRALITVRRATRSYA